MTNALQPIERSYAIRNAICDAPLVRGNYISQGSLKVPDHHAAMTLKAKLIIKQDKHHDKCHFITV